MTLHFRPPGHQRKLPAVPDQRTELRQKIDALPAELEKTIPNLDFTGGLAKIWEVIGLANKYIEGSKPWALSKEGKTAELATVMRDLLDALRIAAFTVYPFMPATAEKMWSQLGLPEKLDSIKLAQIPSRAVFLDGAAVNKAQPLFPRIETK